MTEKGGMQDMQGTQGKQGMQGVQDMKGGMSVEGLTSHLRSGLKIIYVNRGKVIILAAGATLIYYSIATIREFLHLLEEVKGNTMRLVIMPNLFPTISTGLNDAKGVMPVTKITNHLKTIYGDIIIKMNLTG